MQFLHNDRTLFSEGFLYIGGVVKAPEVIQRERTLWDLADMKLSKLSDMTLGELSVIEEIV